PLRSSLHGVADLTAPRLGLPRRHAVNSNTQTYPSSERANAQVPPIPHCGLDRHAWRHLSCCRDRASTDVGREPAICAAELDCLSGILRHLSDPRVAGTDAAAADSSARTCWRFRYGVRRERSASINSRGCTHPPGKSQSAGRIGICRNLQRLGSPLSPSPSHSERRTTRERLCLNPLCTLD